MKALVIGASGHVGAHLVRLLLAQGNAVRALVRPSSRTEGLDGLDVDLVRGDVLDRDSLDRALYGCDHAYHLGAPTGGTPDTERIILEGTTNVLEACRAARVERLLYTSSIVTVGYSTSPDVVLDESTNQFTPATPYHTAKWHAEKTALEFTRTTGMPVVVVNPSTIVGPLDYRVTPSNAPLQRCLDRGIPFSFDSGVTVVHVADVARGHWLAMTRGRPGERYILGGERISIPDWFRLICSACNRKAPFCKIPAWAMMALGAGFSLLRWCGKKQVPFTFTQARQLVGKYGWYSSRKAESELGYTWRPAREAAADYVAWARSRQDTASLPFRPSLDAPPRDTGTRATA